MTGVLGAIPYETFPELELGPLTLRTFGFFVALGVLVGAWFAARYSRGVGHPARRDLPLGHLDGGGRHHRVAASPGC